jgi:hypothetical protein
LASALQSRSDIGHSAQGGVSDSFRVRFFSVRVRFLAVRVLLNAAGMPYLRGTAGAAHAGIRVRFVCDFVCDWGEKGVKNALFCFRMRNALSFRT